MRRAAAAGNDDLRNGNLDQLHEGIRSARANRKQSSSEFLDVVGIEVLFERIGVGEDLIEIEPAGELVCFVGDERKTARFLSVCLRQLNDQCPQLVALAGVSLEDRQQWPGLVAIDSRANDEATRMFKCQRSLVAHSVTLMPGSTIRTEVAGATRIADSS